VFSTNEGRIIHIITFSISCFLQLFSIIQFLLKRQYLNLPPQWFLSSVFLIALSIALSATLYYVRGVRKIVAVLLLRFILVTIIGLPLSDYIGVRFSLWFAFFIEIGLFLRFPVNLLLSSLTLVGTLILRTPLKAWHIVQKTPSLHDLLSLSIYSLFIMAICSLLRLLLDLIRHKNDAIRQMETAVNQLTDANTGFQHYAAIIEKKSTTDERNRIIREIHDSIGYIMTSIIMLMEAALETVKKNGNGSLTDMLKNARSIAKNGLNDIRIALRVLKSKKQASEPDMRTIMKIAKAFEQATGVKVAIEYGNLPNYFETQISKVFFRVIQEGMINAFRHGKATKVQIYFWEHGGEYQITISDNGRGCVDFKEGLGLKGMKERVQKVGGTIDIYSGATGFTLMIKIPKPEAQPEDLKDEAYQSLTGR
jgi:signal transduction histidine kinase